MEYDPQTLRQGRRRLQQWLPSVRAEVARSRASMEVVENSAISKAQAPHVTESNLEAVVIYPAPQGGWHADVLLKQTPPGISNVQGSPSASPYKSKIEAVQFARRLLAFMVLQAMRNAEQPREEKPPAFVLNGYAVDLMPGLVGIVSLLKPKQYTAERAVAHIAEVLAAHDLDPFEPAKFDKLPHDARAAVMSALHIATTVGVYRYPPPRDATPSGHQAPAGTKH